MAKNLDGNEIGVIIEADSLLTQIAKARIAKAKPAKAEPKRVARATATKKA